MKTKVIFFFALTAMVFLTSCDSTNQAETTVQSLEKQGSFFPFGPDTTYLDTVDGKVIRISVINHYDGNDRASIRRTQEDDSVVVCGVKMFMDKQRLSESFSNKEGLDTVFDWSIYSAEIGNVALSFMGGTKMDGFVAVYDKSEDDDGYYGNTLYCQPSGDSLIPKYVDFEKYGLYRVRLEKVRNELAPSDWQNCEKAIKKLQNKLLPEAQEAFGVVRSQTIPVEL